MIKNTSPDKSDKSETLKNELQLFKIFLTNVLIVGDNLLRAFNKFFDLQFYSVLFK